jgi:hypothetical protein
LIEYTVTAHVLFKYMMNLLYTTLIAEWQALDIQYPSWLTTIVMDEFYYTLTLIAVCIASFAVGLAMGFLSVVV